MKKTILALFALLLVSGCTTAKSKELVDPNPDFEVTSNHIQNYNDFALDSFSYFTESSEEVLYSPLSLYIALSLLTEGASGNTEEELLNVLNISRDDLTSMNYQLLSSLPFKEGENQFIINNSLWINNNIDIHKDYLNTIENHYGAEIYQGEINDKLNQKASEWVKENTKGLLNPAIELGSILTIINTLYFKDAWSSPFKAENTYDDDFYLSDGSVAIASYMHQELTPNAFYQNEEYTKLVLEYESGYAMMFVLPAEGVEFTTLLTSRDFMEKNYLSNSVDLHLPKFTQKSDKMQLIALLNSLGVYDAFGSDADFSNITDQPLYVEDIVQETFLSIDEEGGEAAAYTAIMADGMSIAPLETIEVKLNRPFLYVLISPEGYIVFIGITQYPQP